MSVSEQHEEQEETLWRRWTNSKSRNVRERIFEFYKHWAKRIASNLYHKSAFANIEVDDYLHYAYIGLLESIDNFKLSGVKFKGYAVHRVKGSVLNQVFKYSEGASLYAKREKLNNEYIASYVKSSKDQTEQLFGDVVIELAMEFYLCQEDTKEPDEVAIQDSFELYSSSEINLMIDKVFSKKRELKPEYQNVLGLHYRMGFSYQQIADVLEVTKGRVSQIHQMAMQQLRKKLSW